MFSLIVGAVIGSRNELGEIPMKLILENETRKVEIEIKGEEPTLSDLLEDISRILSLYGYCPDGNLEFVPGAEE